MKKNETAEPSFEGARIEFRGDRQVYVDGCAAILEYEPETVKLDVGVYYVRLYGEGLQLMSLTDRSLMIEGTLSGLEFRC